MCDLGNTVLVKKKLRLSKWVSLVFSGIKVTNFGIDVAITESIVAAAEAEEPVQQAAGRMGRCRPVGTAFLFCKVIKL